MQPAIKMSKDSLATFEYYWRYPKIYKSLSPLLEVDGDIAINIPYKCCYNSIGYSMGTGDELVTLELNLVHSFDNVFWRSVVPSTLKKTNIKIFFKFPSEQETVLSHLTSPWISNESLIYSSGAGDERILHPSNIPVPHRLLENREFHDEWDLKNEFIGNVCPKRIDLKSCLLFTEEHRSRYIEPPLRETVFDGVLPSNCVDLIYQFRSDRGFCFFESLPLQVQDLKGCEKFNVESIDAVTLFENLPGFASRHHLNFIFRFSDQSLGLISDLQKQSIYLNMQDHHVSNSGSYVSKPSARYSGFDIEQTILAVLENEFRVPIILNKFYHRDDFLINRSKAELINFVKKYVCKKFSLSVQSCPIDKSKAKRFSKKANVIYLRVVSVVKEMKEREKKTVTFMLDRIPAATGNGTIEEVTKPLGVEISMLHSDLNWINKVMASRAKSVFEKKPVVGSRKLWRREIDFDEIPIVKFIKSLPGYKAKEESRLREKNKIRDVTVDPEMISARHLEVDLSELYDEEWFTFKLPKSRDYIYTELVSARSGAWRVYATREEIIQHARYYVHEKPWFACFLLQKHLKLKEIDSKTELGHKMIEEREAREAEVKIEKKRKRLKIVQDKKAKALSDMKRRDEIKRRRVSSYWNLSSEQLLRKKEECATKLNKFKESSRNDPTWLAYKSKIGERVKIVTRNTEDFLDHLGDMEEKAFKVEGYNVHEDKEGKVQKPVNIKNMHDKFKESSAARESIEARYQYISNNFTFHRKKLPALKPSQKPETLENDFKLAMLRSQFIRAMSNNFENSVKKCHRYLPSYLMNHIMKRKIKRKALYKDDVATDYKESMHELPLGPLRLVRIREIEPPVSDTTQRPVKKISRKKRMSNYFLTKMKKKS